MSSSGGVGSPPVVHDQGMIEFAGETFDPRVASELEQVTSQISASQLETLKDELKAWNLVLEGDHFVEEQDYSAVIGGPKESDEGDALSQELRAEVYEKNNWICPQGNSTREAYASASQEQGFQDSTRLAKEYFENPTEENKGAFIKQFFDYTDGKVNVHELLFLVFKESIQETNNDKTYFLKKLKEYNDMGDDISSYLRELVDASQELTEKTDGMKADAAQKEKVSVDVKEFDLSTLNKDGHLVATSDEVKKVDRTALNDHMKNVESMQETVRNKRQMASTSFQNFDQKANQLYNLISSVMKSMNEMRSGTIRNML
ncbi:MAG: hypothetical protein VX699_07295 [Myxococcota bacterium]|nr:hypothetical protein [Myxococcota bacterium]